MCFTGSCCWERYSYAMEDCICRKPKNMPCPMTVSEEEAEELNELYGGWGGPDNYEDERDIPEYLRGDGIHKIFNRSA